jgi:hypothetical protein
MSQIIRRTVVGLVVGLCLLTPLASAAQRPQQTRIERFSLPTPSELFAGAWRLLSRVWSKEGCMIDPHGICVPKATVVPSSDAGCGLDPYGHCIDAGSSTLDNGCGLDPHGGCIGG